VRLETGWGLKVLKAKFMARRFSQVEGIDYEETFAHVAQYTSIQCCRSVGAKREREREAGARERIFQKMVGSEASPERFYIYI
jgi:hypothetical protein